MSEASKSLSELQAIADAAEKVIRCKGRYHTEQNMIALAALFGVKLPPVAADRASQTSAQPPATKLAALVLELAEAVDNANDDIGGSRGQLDILREAVQEAQRIQP